MFSFNSDSFDYLFDCKLVSHLLLRMLDKLNVFLLHILNELLEDFVF